MRPPEAPSLAELQRRFQAAIVDGSEDVLALIPANSRTTNAVLLGVYRHAYAARLVEVVRSAYPLLAQYMGDVAFEAMARRYVAHYPSRHTNARWFASDVPDLLDQEDFTASPELRDIALIERQLDLAFDAFDAPVLDLATLAAHPPEAWGGLVFTPHPSAALMTLATNAFDIWLALKNEEGAPGALVLPQPKSYLVWRREGVPSIRRLEGEERMLWIEAQRGKSFGGLAEMAAIFDAPDTAALRVAQYLNGWLAAGLLGEAHDLVVATG
jgi:hypothetical protein